MESLAPMKLLEHLCGPGGTFVNLFGEAMLSILVLVGTIRGAPADLEAEQCLLRITDRVVFDEPVLHRRINAVTRDGKGFPVCTYVQHVVVERVRAVEVSWLAQRVRCRIAKARDIAQTRITGKTD